MKANHPNEGIDKATTPPWTIAPRLTEYFYKSSDSQVVQLVTHWFAEVREFHLQRIRLGDIFGHEAAPMRDIVAHRVGGIRLGRDKTLDIHWCLEDEWGYRKLRAKALVPAGTPAAHRVQYHEEHARLQSLWDQHCPKSISAFSVWKAIGVNTSNVLMDGGVMSERLGTAYFRLGFEIDQEEHEKSAQSGRPSAGWITAAQAITVNEYRVAMNDFPDNH